jgi:hypothetical protein
VPAGSTFPAFASPGHARGSRVVVAAEQGRLVLTLADPPRFS